MKLKEFFQTLVAHNQNVEIYFKETTREGVFGFKINDIDSSDLIERLEDCETIFSIMDEINNAFLDSELIDSGEGDTSYLLKPDLSCVKIANYFSPGYEQFWIENNISEFDFGNIILPFGSILITKELDSVKIDEEKTLKDILPKEDYKKFVSFYKELLDEFQEMEIELELELNEDNHLISTIIQMDGSYMETLKFTLLATSVLDIPIKNLKEMLVKLFKIDEQKATLIFAENLIKN